MVLNINPNQKPLFSVVIPTLNSARTIRKSLESVFALNNPRGTVEVLIIDGGSTDNTANIVKEYKTRTIIEPEKGRGLAYNRGFQESKSKYVAFLDSDAIAPKEWLTTGHEILERDSTIAAVHFKNIAPNDSSYFQKCVDTLLSKGWGQANGAIYRRSALEKVEGFNTSLPYLQEDELRAKLLKKGYTMKIVHESLILHHPRSGLKSFVYQCIESGIGAEKLAVILKRPKLFASIFLNTVVALWPFLTIGLLILQTNIGLTAMSIGLIATLFYSVLLWRSTSPKYRHPKYVFPATFIVWVSKLSNLLGYILAILKRTRK